MSQTTKGGNVRLTRINVPTDVDPGESFEVEAVVNIDGWWVNPWDPDECDQSHTATMGPGYEIVIDFDGPGYQTHEVGPVCQPTTEIGMNEEKYTATFTAPSTSGATEVSVNVRLPGSGKSTGGISETVTVASGTPASPDNTSDERDDDGGDGGNWWEDFEAPDGGDGNPLVPDWAGPLAGLLLLLAALWVARPYVELLGSVGGSS